MGMNKYILIAAVLLVSFSAEAQRGGRAGRQSREECAGMWYKREVVETCIVKSNPDECMKGTIEDKLVDACKKCRFEDPNGCLAAINKYLGG